MEQFKTATTDVNEALSREQASLLAAREIVKSIEGFELIEYPVEYYNEDTEELHSLNYDDVVSMFENIIRHFYGQEPRDESL